ncbi:oxygenase MpaB family protein [Mycobacterium sp. NPDC050441]|uniref:oxygenase MpaB family protein n=1 Tax=Mycobacterium sp. NPDC050441 TaxID=3155403 RepID=UPI0033DCF8F4
MTRVTDQQFHLDLPSRREDEGLFGPGSVSWRVWSHPATIPGVMRSFVLDMVASTHGAAALEDHSRYREDPLGRLNRTMYYFLTAVFADTATVTAANQRLDRLHARITGTEPMSGQSYSAMDPYLRLGNHMLSWHSVFFAYQTLAGGLTPQEQDQFFAEAAIAFETFGIDYDDIRAAAAHHGIVEQLMPERIPSSRDDYRRLWTASRHLICVNAQTRGAPLTRSCTHAPWMATPSRLPCSGPIRSWPVPGSPSYRATSDAQVGYPPPQPTMPSFSAPPASPPPPCTTAGHTRTCSSASAPRDTRSRPKRFNQRTPDATGL